jgi:hypothetical protein
MERGLIAIAIISFALAAVAQARLPEDVARFVERRDECDHFRGEAAYDSKRREFLEQQTLELCAGSDKQLAELKKKYARDQTVMTRLDEYEAEIESPAAK